MEKSLSDWQIRAKETEIPTQAFIDGAYLDAQSGATFDCINPATGARLAQVAACESADVDMAVAAARRAFVGGSWSKADFGPRKDCLRRLARLILEHREELALLETLDTGKPITESLTVDVPNAARCFEWFAEAIDKVNDELVPTGSEALALVTREPLGVVGAVIPWNFPLILLAWKVAPALASGNTVVLKPAEQSPLSAIRVASLAVEAGIPAGVFNVVPGLGETAGRAIGLHMDVDAVAFTGSTAVGKLFLTYAGQSNMKRISLECGGKSPQIILADCPDLDRAASCAAWGIFYNQGEVCHAGSRVLVEASLKDALLQKLMDWGKRLAPGDPLDPATQMGALIDENQLERVMNYIEVGKKEGAELVLGGERARVASGGAFVEPTIFDSVKNEMRIAQEEIFGPVLSVLSFRDLTQAIQIANDTIYGLAAAIWTRDIGKAHRTARALRAGTVWVNTYDQGTLTVPFGGFKQSGFGRDKSLHALKKYTDLKTTWINLQER